MQIKPSNKTEQPVNQMANLIKRKSDAVTKFFKNENTW